MSEGQPLTLSTFGRSIVGSVDQRMARRLRTTASVCLAAIALTISMLGHEANGQVYPAFDTGWYDDTGFHQATNYNHLAGWCAESCDPATEYRNFFVFDLSSVVDPVMGAALHVRRFGTELDVDGETYTLFDALTPIPALVAGGSGLTGVFADLGTGDGFGERNVGNVADIGGGLAVTVPLNSSGVSAINAAAGGNFALGGAVTTLAYDLNDESLFAGSRDICGGPCADLILNMCSDTAASTCLDADRAKLKYDERKQNGERMKLLWKKISTDTTQGDFGDPVSGDTAVSVCIYDDSDILVQNFFVVRAGPNCGYNYVTPCWRARGSEGYSFKENSPSSDGITKIMYRAGDPGKGRVSVQGRNHPLESTPLLPTGVAPALSGNLSPTIQIVTSDGLCVGATMNYVQKDDGARYTARKR